MDLDYRDYAYFIRKVTNIEDGVLALVFLVTIFSVAIGSILIVIMIRLAKIQNVIKTQTDQLKKLNAFFDGRPVEIHQPGIPPIPRHESET